MQWRRPLFSAGLFLCCTAAVAPAQPVDWTGSWTGAFGAGGGADGPGVILRLEPGPEGWAGRIDMPAHGVFDVRTRVRLVGDSVRIEIGELSATFAGMRTAGKAGGWLRPRRRGAAPATISGLWRQHGGIVALRLVRTSTEPVLSRPQEPTGPRPYRETVVRFPGAGDSHVLEGTLALPAGPGPHPAAVLISGSGPHDRDGSIAGHRPFLVLADHLVRRGVAVLRFDERGVGASTGDFATATSADFAADVGAALEFLATRPDLDRSRIGLIGHSEGGMVAPMVANRVPGVAFLVLLAAPGLPLAEVSVLQSASILRAEGRPEHEVAASRRTAERLMQLVAGTDDAAAVASGAREILHSSLDPLALPPRVLERQLELGVERFTSPWMQFAARHDPRAELRRITDIPVLALNGSRDTQVAAEPNLDAIRRALAAAGNDRATVRVLPGLNHLFQSARTGAPSEYGAIEETFAPTALRAVTEWIAAWTRPAAHGGESPSH